jgi:hypothetical protein
MTFLLEHQPFHRHISPALVIIIKGNLINWNLTQKLGHFWDKISQNYGAYLRFVVPSTPFWMRTYFPVSNLKFAENIEDCKTIFRFRPNFTDFYHRVNVLFTLKNQS